MNIRIVMMITLGSGIVVTAMQAYSQESKVAPGAAPVAAATPTPAPTPAATAAPAPRAVEKTAPAAARIPNSNAAAATGVVTPKFQPQSVILTLINGMTLSGTLSEVDQWSMKTSLGTTNVPVSAVAGVRMAQEGNATTTIVLHNGDSITGALQLNQIMIQMDWGRAEIYGTHVTSIMFTPGLKWTTETGLSGTRWKLVADESQLATIATRQAGANGVAASGVVAVPARTTKTPAPPQAAVPGGRR